MFDFQRKKVFGKILDCARSLFNPYLVSDDMYLETLPNPQLVSGDMYLESLFVTLDKDV